MSSEWVVPVFFHQRVVFRQVDQSDLHSTAHNEQEDELERGSDNIRRKSCGGRVVWTFGCFPATKQISRASSDVSPIAPGALTPWALVLARKME
jgi:hypothetical protein